jgi:ribonuclease J
VNLTIHRGTREVGGTCIEVEAGQTRVVLDLGMPLFDAGGNSRDARKTLRQGTQTLRADGTLPAVSGLWDDEVSPDAILLSHAHSDHSGLVSLSKPGIPVYLTAGTSKMLLAASVFAGQPPLPRGRARLMKPGMRFRVGDLTVTALSVDHSAFDSVALLLEHGGQRVLYSGDLRLHGRKPGMTRALLSQVRRTPVDALLLEGTHVGSSKSRQLSEVDLEEDLVKRLRATNGLILAAFSPLNVDRLVSYYKAARRSGRVFVVDPYTAFVLHLVAGQCSLPRPGKGAQIQVLYPDYRGPGRKPPDKILRLFRPSEISLEQILSAPARHLMVYRERVFRNDMGGKLPSGTLVLYSYWSGYLEQQRGREFRNRLESAGAKIALAHASGHIYPEDLSGFVRAINPKVLIPVHTFHPRRFVELWPGVRLPKDGERISV